MVPIFRSKHIISYSRFYPKVSLPCITVYVGKVCTRKFLIKWHNYANSANPDQTAAEGAI